MFKASKGIFANIANNGGTGDLDSQFYLQSASQSGGLVSPLAASEGGSDASVTFSDASSSEVPLSDAALELDIGGKEVPFGLPCITDEKLLRMMAEDSVNGRLGLFGNEAPAATDGPIDDEAADIPIAVGGTASGVIDVLGDTDTFTVALVAGQRYMISLRGTSATALADSFLEVFDPAMAVVNTDDDGGVGHDSLMTITAGATGTYTIRASSFGNAGTGGYTVDVRQMGVDSVPSTVPSTVTISQGITFGFRETATASGGADSDIYNVNLVAGHYYVFNVSGGMDHNSNPNAVPVGEIDTIIALRGPNGSATILQQNDDIAFPSDNSSSIGFYATVTGTYYLQVTGYSQGAVPLRNTGGYVIDFHEVPLEQVDPLESIDWNNAANIPTTLVNGVPTAYIYFAVAGENFGENARAGDPTQPAGGGNGTLVSYGWDPYEKAQFMLAMQEYTKILGIAYVETANSAQATFRVITNSSLAYGAYAYPQDPAYGTQKGIMVFNVDNRGWNLDSADPAVTTDGLGRGGYAWSTILHEAGHAHGLAHPHDQGGGSLVMAGVTGAQGSLGVYNLNQGVYTQMSYNGGWQTHPDGALTGASNSDPLGFRSDAGWLATMGAFDIAKLQARYGVHPDYATGDTVYTMLDVNAEGTYWETIYDTGGNDTIAYNGVRGAQIDLNTATLDYSVTGGGIVSFVHNLPGETTAQAIKGGFTIANGVVIENATGGSGNDVLIGNGAGNVLTGNGGNDAFRGNGGNDTLVGGLGTDTAHYAGARANYTVTPNYDGNGNVISWTVTDIVPANAAAINDEGSDTLTGVEQVQFSDSLMVLDGTVDLYDASNVFVATYNTIQEAIDAASDGYRLVASEGLFNENVIVNKDVTIEGANVGVAGSGVRGDESVIDGQVTISASGVTINGVTISGAAAGSIGNTGVEVSAGSNDFSLVNSILDGGGDFAMVVSTVTGLDVGSNLVRGYSSGIYLGGGTTTGSIHDNRFQGDGGPATGLGNGVLSETSNTDIADNVFDGLYGGSIFALPFGPDTVNLNDYITGNSITNSGIARPVQILPSNLTHNIIGTDFNEAFDGETAAGSYGVTGPFSFDGRGGDDHAWGGGEGDTFTGGAGNDQFFGNGGTDTAVYAGPRSDYTVVAVTDSNGVVTGFSSVTDNVATGLDEGTDSLTSIEKLQFADGTLDLAQRVQLFNGSGALVGTFNDIQAAINAASDGYRIEAQAGTYNENLNVDVDVTIEGANSGIPGTGTRGAETIVNGQVTISASGVTINGVTISGAAAGSIGNTGVEVSAGSNDFSLVNSILDGGGDFAMVVSTVTGLDIGSNLVRGYSSGIYLGGGTTTGSIHDNRFQGDGGPATGLGNGVLSETSHTDIADNIFDGLYGGSIFALPFGPDTVNLNDYITGNTITNSGIARPVQILPSNLTHNIIGTDFNEAFDGETAAGSYGVTGAFSFDGRGGDDRAWGGEQGDTFTGGAGADHLFGNGGSDTAAFAGPRTDYTIVGTINSAGMYTSFGSVTDNNATGLDEGTDQLTSIEKLQFANVTLDIAHPVQLFDGSGNLVGTFATIQGAIDAASNGYRIEAAPGTYAENLTIDVDVTIEGNNSGIAGTGVRGAETIIDGQIVIAADGVTIDGVKVVGSAAGPIGTTGIVVDSGSDNFSLVNSWLASDDASDFAIFVGAVTGLNVGSNLIEDYSIGMYIATADTAGSVHDNRFQGDGPLSGTGLGNGVNSETSHVTITNNVFDGIYAGSLNLFPFGPDTVDLTSYVIGNTITNSGAARPVQILPTNLTHNILGTDFNEAFDGETAAANGVTGAFSFDGRGGDDRAWGAGEIDTFTGGAGDDWLFGNAGDDNAIFSGNRNQYLVTPIGPGIIQVADQRPGTPDGTDRLEGIERLVFTDNDYWVEADGSLTPINDAPLGIDHSITLVEDAANVLTLAHFSYTDTENYPLLSVRIVDLPTGGGTIYFDADGAGGNAPVAISAGDTFSVADINAGKLTYVGPLNVNGTGRDSFTYQVRDNGGTAHGGFDTDPVPNTITVDLTAVNDAPTIGGDGTESTTPITEDIPSTTGDTVSSVVAGQFSDPADLQQSGGNPNGSLPDDFAGVAITANGSSATTGQWQYHDGSAWVDIGSRSDSSALLLAGGTFIRFNPALNFFGEAPVLTVHLIDDSAAAVTTGAVVDLSAPGATGGSTVYSTGTVAIGQTVIEVNEPPVPTVGPAVAAVEDGAPADVTGISVFDFDENPATVRITMHLSVLHGRLAIDTNVAGGITFSDITGGNNNSSGIIITATQDQINTTLAATGGLTYTSDPNFNGTDTLTVATYDNIHTDPASFLAPSTLASAAAPSSIVTADVNGDGDLDLVYAAGATQIGIRTGNGDGTFDAETLLSGADQPRSVIVTDLNGDGNEDVVVANYADGATPGGPDGSVGVFYGTGGGAFGAMQTLATVSSAQDVLSGDYDGDGRLDLAVASRDTGTIQILLQTTPGVFVSGPTLNATSTNLIQSIVQGDFNSDGRLDLISFNPNTRTATPANGTISVMFGNGDGTFQSSIVFHTSSANRPFEGVVGDFNGDGELDIGFTREGAGTVSTIRGLGNGFFLGAVNTGFSAAAGAGLTAADANGDGTDDLIVSNPGAPGSATVIVSNGNGTYRPAVSFTAGTNPNSTALGDFNGDGEMDLATANAGSGDITIRIGSSHGTGNSATQTINVAPSNDQPVVVNGGTVAATTIAEETPLAAGQTVSSLFASHLADPVDDRTEFGGSDPDEFAGIAIVDNPSSPTTGQWQYYNGSAWVDIGPASFTAAVLLNGSTAIRFNPAVDFFGAAPELVSHLVEDSGGAFADGTTVDLSVNLGSTSRYTASSVVLTQEVTPVNDPPVNTTAAVSTDEEVSVTVTGFSVLDVDASGDLTVTLTVTSGRLELDTFTSGGVTSGQVSGNNTSSITITATQEQINATLGNTGLTYFPADNYNGAATITMTSNDGSLGDTDNQTITINPVNDAPTVSGDGTEDAATIDEDVPSATGQTVLVLFGGQYSDSADQQQTGPNPTGSVADTLAGIAIVANGSGASTGQWQYHDGSTWVDIGPASQSAAVLIAAGTAIRFNPAPNFNGTAPTLTAHLVDSSGGAITDGETVDLSAVAATGFTTEYSTGTVVLSQSVTAVNDAPVNSSAPLTTSEDSSNVALTGYSISDSEADPANDDMTVTFSVSHGTLIVATGVAGGVGAGDVTGNGTATVVITGTQNEINATLAAGSGLTYTPTANFHGDDTIQMVTSDQGHTGAPGAQSDTDNETITVSSINDEPAGADNSKTIDEDGTYTFAAVDFGFTDPNDPDAFSAVKITTAPTDGQLLWDSDGNSGTAAVVVTSGTEIPIADINAGRLVFAPTANENGTPYATFTFQVRDNGGTPGIDLDQSPNTFTLNVNAINDSPVVPDSPGTTTDEQVAVILNPTITVSDVDLDARNGGNGDYDDATFMIARTSPNAEDVFSFATAGALFTVSGGNLQAGGLTFATFSQSGGTLTIQFDSTAATATTALVNDVLRHLQYTNSSDTPPASVTLNYQLNDGAPDSVQGTIGGSAIDSGSIVVIINAINDVPAIDLNGAGGGTSNTVAYTEGQSTILLAPSSTLVDPDSPDFDTGTLTVAFTANGEAGDRLVIVEQGTGVGQLSVGEAEIYYNFGHVDGNGDPIGPEQVATYGGGTDGSTPLIISFNANASRSIVEQILRQIGYFNITTNMTDADRTLTWTLTDGDGGTSNAANVFINVTTVEEVPIAFDDTFLTDDNVAFAGNVFGENGGGSDFDPDGNQTFEVTAVNGNPLAVGQEIILPSGAKLKLNADGTFTYDPNGVYNSLVPEESGAANHHDANQFTYTITGGSTATVTIVLNGIVSPGDIYKGDVDDNIITGTDSANFFLLTQGGDDQAFGLGGNDFFFFGNAFTSADAVDGGAGNDQMALQGNYAVTFGAGVINLESLVLLPGNDTRFGDVAGNFYDYSITTVNANLAAGVRLTIDANRLRAGEDFTFNGSAETDGNFFVVGGHGVDNFTGGSQSDTFLFSENGQWGSSDVINGGPGGANDQLALRGNYTIVFGAGQLIAIDSIALVSAQDTRFGPLGSVYNYNLTMNDGNVLAGQMLTVDAAPLRAGESLTFDGGAETDGILRVVGGTGADTIAGGQFTDILIGRGGADVLTGRGGNDQFRYDNVSESNAAVGRDQITDFLLGDLIDLQRIDANSNTTGTNEAFTFIGGNTFSGTAGELRAQVSAGNTWTVQGDTNGDGLADFEILVTTPDNNAIIASDFLL